MSDAPPEYPACSCCGEPESGTCPEQRCRDCDHNCPAGGPCTLTSPALPLRCHVSPRCYWCTMPFEQLHRALVERGWEFCVVNGDRAYYERETVGAPQIEVPIDRGAPGYRQALHAALSVFAAWERAERERVRGERP